MKHSILVWAALALLLGGIAPAVVQGGTIAYDIQNYPAEQGQHTLSGLIITDGKIGALAASDILSWTFTVDSSITVSGGASSVTLLGDVEASPTQITLAQPPAPPGHGDRLADPLGHRWRSTSRLHLATAEAGGGVDCGNPYSPVELAP